ncbi:hypothetical protein D6779_07035 [Candidatus Parcubacteria bacterium]|nr:MAG: hypothetical protein D6779_07035 [Candidatus Parcubacteria bacterium]
MIDLIAYCADTKALMAEVAKVAPDYLIKDEQDNPIGFSITKTPTVKQTTGKGKAAKTETLARVRVTDEELAIINKLTTLKILAQAPVQSDPTATDAELLNSLNSNKKNRAIYDKIHPRTPIPVLDEKGNQLKDANGKPVTYTPPELIGSFA